MKLETISPIDNSIYCSFDAHNQNDVDIKVKNAQKVFKDWSKKSIEERISFVQKMIDYIVSQEEIICKEISWQMGRPYKQVSGEIAGFKQRAEYMISIAIQSLQPYYPINIPNFERWISKEPLGVITVLSPWNYPFLTSVNVIIPALIAGNVVILKHSSQTPLVAEHYKKASLEANFPEGVFDILHLSHNDTNYLISQKEIQGVYFTGSVEGGKKVQQAICNKFVICGLELGGKDPAYIRADADIPSTVESLVDGAFFNSGQSCCGIERIYAHEKVYDDFIDLFVKLTKDYCLGNPLEDTTNLGPMVRTKAANFVREQIQEAIKLGANSLVQESDFLKSQKNTPYLAPQVLVNVNHQMRVMVEESFGPVVGIMKVKTDEEAINLMNDSDLGLTASIWGKDAKIVRDLSTEVQAGTVFFNRCDYLDPALAWTGVKNTGRGITLSAWGYDHLTRAKSYHFRLN